ncbi:MAG TPA: helix-hairpin-helix domain-containing protein [Streptosporangiaceae bacterium]|jgi:DNA uptake protein ComE-like DNA-binding protein|nr:helix-hairpin-helix domain-containing protein [Streptosporangiaceae bacterium]
MELTQASASDLVTQINAAAANISLLPLIVLLWLPVITIPLAMWLHARDKARRMVVVFYEVSGASAEKFQSLTDAFTLMQQSNARWYLTARGAVSTTRQYKVNAGASNIIKRVPGRADVAGPPLLATNIAVPSLHARKRSVYFLPDRVLIRDGRKYADVPYSSCQASGTMTRFIEEGRRPKDARQVDTTWKYVNKGGGPDRRYKNNPKLPVMQYSQLSLSAEPGFRFQWQASRADAAPAFAAALSAMKTVPVAAASPRPVPAQPQIPPARHPYAAEPQTPGAREMPPSPRPSPPPTPSLRTMTAPPESMRVPSAPTPLPARQVAQANEPQTHASRFRGKAWLLLAIPLGFTTWAAFLYIGVRARRPVWLAWAAVYAATLAGYATLDTPAHPSNTAQGIAAVLAMVTWIGGGIHAMLVSNDAVRRIQARTDPDLEAARVRIQRRAEGRHLTATQPALAREVGVGRPDLAGADDYGLVDVNHASAAAIARLPGMTDQLARRTVDARIQAGGFSSVEDLGMLLNLRPDTVDQMRDMAIFPADKPWQDHEDRP